MKYFLDTEFIEDGAAISLISIGIVAEDGREYYAESREVSFNKADPWLVENVIPHLWRFKTDKTDAFAKAGGAGGYMLRSEIAEDIERLFNPDLHGKPELWAYYASYDFVAFCQLFGRMIDLPKDFPKYCNDVKQLCVSLGNPELPKQETQEHHALYDARWTRDAYLWLIKQQEEARC